MVEPNQNKTNRSKNKAYKAEEIRRKADQEIRSQVRTKDGADIVVSLGTNASKYRKTSGLIKEDETIFKKSQLDSKAHKRAAEAAAKSDFLLGEVDGLLMTEDKDERTYHMTQKVLKEEVDTATQAKMFSLDMKELGPYNVSYSRDGNRLALAGRKGHITMFDWKRLKLVTEINVNDTIRDVQFLHNSEFIAVAQEQKVYLYDSSGTEVHCMVKDTNPYRLDFLPYHFLLTTVGEFGRLRYTDTTTGMCVSDKKTRLGTCNVMRHNPRNAVVHLGHHNGTVTLWTPNMLDPVVTMKCSKSPIDSLAIDQSGNYMVTSSADKMIRTWDLRTYREVCKARTFHTCTDLDISYNGVVASVQGPKTFFWRNVNDLKNIYMRHTQSGGTGRSIRFCPMEDFAGYGHQFGFQSLLVPGSGQANIDSFEVNPYATGKWSRNQEVRSLLDKIKPDVISLDDTKIGEIEHHAETAQDNVHTANNVNFYRPEFMKKARKAITSGKVTKAEIANTTKLMEDGEASKGKKRGRRGVHKIKRKLAQKDIKYQANRKEKIKVALAAKNQ